MWNSSRRVLRSASIIPIHDYRSIEFWNNDVSEDEKLKCNGPRSNENKEVPEITKNPMQKGKVKRKTGKKWNSSHKGRRHSGGKITKAKDNQSGINESKQNTKEEINKKVSSFINRESNNGHVVAMVPSSAHGNNLEIAEINEQSEFSDIMFEQDTSSHSATDSQILQEESLNLVLHKNLILSNSTNEKDDKQADKLVKKRRETIESSSTNLRKGHSTMNWIIEQSGSDKNLLTSKVHKFEEMTRALQEEIKSYEEEIERDHHAAIAKVNEYYLKLRESHKQRFNECLQLVHQQLKSRGALM